MHRSRAIQAVLSATLLIAVSVFAAGCGGGDDELSNDEYGEELQEIFDTIEGEFESADSSAEGSLNEFADLIDDALDDLDDLQSEESDVQDAQDEFVSANREVAEAARELADDNDDFSSDEAFSGDADTSEIQAASTEGDEACLDFQAALDEAGISADLECGG